MSAYLPPSTNATASTGAPTGGTAAGARPGPAVMSDEALVYTVDLLLAILIALYALVRLPRALALFGSSKEWLNGHFIRSVPYRPGFTTAHRYPSAKNEKVGDNYGGAWSSDDSHDTYNRPTAAQRFDENGLPVAPKLPPHVAACPRLLRSFLTLLRMRVGPGFAVSQAIILTAYFFCVAYVGFYRSNVFSDSTRTGWVAISQLPVVFAFAQKNNVLGWALGYGYEKLNFLHRFAGRLVVLAANIHSLHWIYKWSLAGTLSQRLQSPSNYWGLIALICMDLLFFGSTEYWRKKAYNLFLTTHIVGFCLVLPAMYLHKKSMLIFIWACLAAYGMDHLFRILKTRVATAHLRPLPELEATRIEIPTLNAGWRAGQHVRLRVLSTAMGLGAWMEVHPFTIASVSKSDEGMVLLVKKAGGWTRKMFDVAKSNESMMHGIGRDMKVMVEGPYGGPTHAIMSSFSAAVFVAGGSGITFALSAIQDLIQKDLAGESRVRLIELVWSISDPAALAPLLPQLSCMIQQSVCPLHISVFYTRASGKQSPFGTGSSPGPMMSSFEDSAFRREKVAISRLPKALNLQASPRAAGGYPISNEPHASVKRSATLTAWERLHGVSANSKPIPPSPAPGRVPEKPLPEMTGPKCPPGLSLSAGRPRVLDFLESALDRTIALKKGQYYTRASDAPRLTGLLVGVCGPLAMADSVIQAVGSIDSARRDEIGGIEIVEEGFGW